MNSNELILLVDSTQMLTQIIAPRLRQNGFLVESVPTFEEAFERLASKQFHFVVAEYEIDESRNAIGLCEFAKSSLFLTCSIEQVSELNLLGIDNLSRQAMFLDKRIIEWVKRGAMNDES